MVITIGKTVNSFSGGLNTGTTLVVYLLNLLNTSSATNALVLMYAAQSVTPTTQANLDFGTEIGIIISQILNFSVPDATYVSTSTTSS